MDQNQSNEKEVTVHLCFTNEAPTVDALFNKQKEKVNIIAEIFNQKELFLKDERIKRALSKKLNDKGFVWLRNRIIELRTVHKLVSN